jgi:hypothetical protein
MSQPLSTHSPLRQSTFAIRTHNIGAPAAGSEAIWIAPNNWRARLIAVSYDVTIAQPNPAYPELHFGTSGPDVAHIYGDDLIPNLASRTIHWTPMVAQTFHIAAHNLTLCPLPPLYLYEDGYSLRIRVTNIANATQLSNIRFSAYEYTLA